jgi:hypothetical protein
MDKKETILLKEPDAKVRRNCVINFKVTEQEKKLIEDHAWSNRLGVSEYVRQSVFLDLMVSGNIEAIKYIASEAKQNMHILKKLISIFANKTNYK